MSDTKYYAKGNRVASTRWDATEGTVVRVDDDSVYVAWDGTCVEDQTSPADIRPI